MGACGPTHTLAPSLAGDQAFRDWFARYLRLSASPRAAAAVLRMNTQIDTRAILPTIRVPSLLIYRTGDYDVLVDEGKWIASQIPDARFVELPGSDHLMWAGDAGAILDEIEAFLTGVRRGPTPDRSSRPCCSQTSPARPSAPRRWATTTGRV